MRTAFARTQPDACSCPSRPLSESPPTCLPAIQISDDLNRLEKVGQFQQLVEMSELNPDLKHKVCGPGCVLLGMPVGPLTCAGAALGRRLTSGASCCSVEAICWYW